jgi:hypothetical protein
LITVDDLVRDGFGPSPLFHVFVAEVASEIIGIALYYYRYSTWKGKTIHLEDLVVKEKNAWYRPVMLCIQKLSNKVKDQVRRVEWNVPGTLQQLIFMKNQGLKYLEIGSANG